MAKLNFTKIRSKNFRSIGAHFLEIDLNKGNTLVFSNDNGAGKSTGLLYALYYVLFDKSYKKGQKKTSLLNSKNGKDCIVEVEFETKGSKWLVRRGMKPNLFDIERDGVRVPDEAAGSDYQAYLLGILGFDDKVFNNVIGLGRDKFVPFNELDAASSRNLGEVMLDQGIFSKANEITKEEIKAKNRELTDLGYEIDKTKSKIQNSERMLVALRQALESKNADKQGIIDKTLNDLMQVNGKLALAEQVSTAHAAEVDALKEQIAKDFPPEFLVQHDKMNNMLIQLKAKKSNLENTRHRFLSMTTCPTCEQEVSEERKEQVKAKINPEVDSITAGVQKLEGLFAESQVKLTQREESNRKLSDAVTKARVLQEGINGIKNQIGSLEALLSSLHSSKNQPTSQEASQIAAEELTLESLKSELEGQLEAEKNGMKVRSDLTTLLTFLKDDGFKAEITRRYIPLLNHKLNEFLDAMNLFVNIVIDEEFNMTMVAPDRKNQTIADLSTGQTCRIDLGMLLGWREVAKTKSSVDTNLLILDETLENLSPQGVSDFVEYMNMKNPEGLNMFVITQRGQEFSEHFDNTIEYVLKDEFTVRL